MKTSIYFHNVTSIRVGPIKHLSGVGSYSRHVEIINDAGEGVDIACFAKDRETLEKIEGVER